MMEALPTPRFKRGLSASASNRKRRRDESGNEIDADGSEGTSNYQFRELSKMCLLSCLSWLKKSFEDRTIRLAKCI